jgi:hypothetical protein
MLSLLTLLIFGIRGASLEEIKQKLETRRNLDRILSEDARLAMRVAVLDEYKNREGGREAIEGSQQKPCPDEEVYSLLGSLVDEALDESSELQPVNEAFSRNADIALKMCGSNIIRSVLNRLIINSPKETDVGKQLAELDVELSNIIFDLFNQIKYEKDRVEYLLKRGPERIIEIAGRAGLIRVVISNLEGFLRQQFFHRMNVRAVANGNFHGILSSLFEAQLPQPIIFGELRSRLVKFLNKNSALLSIPNISVILNESVNEMKTAMTDRVRERLAYLGLYYIELKNREKELKNLFISSIDY